MQTSNTTYFVGSNCMSCGKELVNAAADEKRAEHAIDSYLFKKR